MKIEYNAKIVSVCLQNLIACIELILRKIGFQQAEIETFKSKKLIIQLLADLYKGYFMLRENVTGWQLGNQEGNEKGTYI